MSRSVPALSHKRSLGNKVSRHELMHNLLGGFPPRKCATSVTVTRSTQTEEEEKTPQKRASEMFQDRRTSSEEYCCCKNSECSARPKYPSNPGKSERPRDPRPRPGAGWSKNRREGCGRRGNPEEWVEAEPLPNNFVKRQVQIFDGRLKGGKRLPVGQCGDFKSLMERVRSGMPREGETQYSVCDESGWSDSFASDEEPPVFPRETKNAVSMMLDDRTRERNGKCHQKNKSYHYTDNTEMIPVPAPWPGSDMRVSQQPPPKHHRRPHTRKRPEVEEVYTRE